MSLDKWDRRFLQLAQLVSTWSKDPRTKTGAVIVDDNRIVSLGFNGLPAKVSDDLPDRYNDREKKLSMIVHCEMNAILFSSRGLQGCTLYTYPFASCSNCAGMVVQAGITRVVAPRPIFLEPDHWMHKSLELTRTIFTEAGVRLIEVEVNLE